MKNLNNNFYVQVLSAEQSNEQVRYALIHGDISTMHELVAYAHKFVETDEMKDHHLVRAQQI